MSNLRIAITADPEIPVPPKHYGGIERIVHLLVCGLSARGHEVTLFAHRDSQVPCRLVPYAERLGRHIVRNAARIGWEIRKTQFDLIHSFGRLAYLSTVLPRGIPKLMSYQRHITPRSVKWGTRLASGTLQFAACSRHMVDAVSSLATWHVIYNGVSSDLYTPQSTVTPDAPLVFLGRVEQIKGAHLAVEVARRVGRKLVIAGNIPPGGQHAVYFDTQIKPYLDNDLISYVGPVDDAGKNALLGRAAALLMPILWDEPFGIVMAESLACGTPIIGFRRGSVPEVVDHGVNGYVCENVSEMVSAVSRIHEIDRRACRRVMESRFSGPAMVDRYLEVYRALLRVPVPFVHGSEEAPRVVKWT